MGAVEPWRNSRTLVLERAAPRRAGTAASPRRRWLIAATWLLGAAVAFAGYLRLAGTRAVNSDGSSQALQAWDMLHGNLLLHGWTLTDVSFYTTELPEYMVVEQARGLNADVVHVAAAITYTLAVLLAALLAKGAATGRAAAVRGALAAGIMLAPQLSSGTDVLLSSPDHIGTSVPVMLTWLILDRARPRWYVPVLASLLLAWAMVADMLVLVIGVAPLAGVCAIRAARALLARERPLREQWYEIALGAAAAAAVPAAILAMCVIRAPGGFDVQPLDSQLSSSGMIAGHNLRLTVKGLLLLAGADFRGLPAGAGRAFAMLHIAGVAVAACGIAVAARRFRRGGDLVAQVLLAGIAANIAAYLAGTYAVILADAREMAPVLPFAAALAGRASPWRLPGGARRMLGAALGLVAAGYLAGLGLEISQPQAPPQSAQLTSWLERHPLGTGLSGYWQGNVVTLTSGGQARIRPLRVADGRLVPAHNTQAAWYDPVRSAADFVVLCPGAGAYPGFSDRRLVLATFGEPARTYHVGPYTILFWHKNLLASLRLG
jgi:hypothetical protein